MTGGELSSAACEFVLNYIYSFFDLLKIHEEDTMALGKVMKIKKQKFSSFEIPSIRNLLHYLRFSNPLHSAYKRLFGFIPKNISIRESSYLNELMQIQPSFGSEFKKSLRDCIQSSTLPTSTITFVSSSSLIPISLSLDWVMANYALIFQLLCAVFSLVFPKCTKEKCPSMETGESIQLNWRDKYFIKKAIPMSASEYILLSLDWIIYQVTFSFV
jgi:hypothetical protein